MDELSEDKFEVRDNFFKDNNTSFILSGQLNIMDSFFHLNSSEILLFIGFSCFSRNIYENALREATFNF
jgi:hypothetical protein